LLFGAEAVAISQRLWSFFGNNPFVVLGLPLWVALTNIAAVYAWATAGAYCLDRLTGPRTVRLTWRRTRRCHRWPAEPLAELRAPRAAG
jgi:hypothetical protein